MRNFNILVGPNQGTFKKCGSSSNNMSILGECKGFVCESDAKGVSVKITVKGKNKLLTLCEVFIVGTGMDDLNIFIAIISMRM